MMASQPSSFLHNRFVSMIGRPRTHKRITGTLRWMIDLTSLILSSKARRKQEQNGEVIEILNRMQADGVIERFAIGGGIAAIRYLEPYLTDDIDIFLSPVVLSEG